VILSLEKEMYDLLTMSDMNYSLFSSEGDGKQKTNVAPASAT
jgi:hypothetical protein